MKLLFLVSVFILFLFIILYGGRLIYSMETIALEDKAASELDHNKRTVREFFSACSKYLTFLRNLPGINEYLGASPMRVRPC